MFARAAVLGLFVSLSSLVSLPAAAQPDPNYLRVLQTDAPRASDISWLGRYTGSHLVGQTIKQFDELKLPAGPSVGKPYANDKRFSEVLTVQGRVTRTAYVSPAGRSSLEVHTNYREAALKAGFQPVFECSGEACGESFPVLKYSWDNKAAQPHGEGYEQVRGLIITALFGGVLDPRYALLKKTAPEGDSYLALYSALNRGGSSGAYSDLIRDRVSVLVEAVEPRAMDRAMEVVSAEEIGSKLGSQGKAVFYGIQFDTDKADIKPASAPQLAQMVAFLTKNPQANVYVVGHTDTQGALDYNINLSNRRAQALVKALTERGISASRLTARGLGPLAPVATNRTEDGRAQNRRVEMVER